MMPRMPLASGVHDTNAADASEAISLAVWDGGMLDRVVGDNIALHRHLLGKFQADAQDQVARICHSAAAHETGIVIGVASVIAMLAIGEAELEYRLTVPAGSLEIE